MGKQKKSTQKHSALVSRRGVEQLFSSHRQDGASIRPTERATRMLNKLLSRICSGISQEIALECAKPSEAKLDRKKTIQAAVRNRTVAQLLTPAHHQAQEMVALAGSSVCETSNKRRRIDASDVHPMFCHNGSSAAASQTPQVQSHNGAAAGTRSIGSRVEQATVHPYFLDWCRLGHPGCTGTPSTTATSTAVPQYHDMSLLFCV